MWVQTHELLGQRIAQAFANNGDFVANVLDNLSGSSALDQHSRPGDFHAPVRARRSAQAPGRRPLAQQGAGAAVGAAADRSETDRIAKQAKRSGLAHADAGAGAGTQALHRREGAQVRKELRETQRGLDVDINRLDTWLKVINIAVAPLAVAVAGVLILALRRRRKSLGSELGMSRRRFIVAAGRGAARHLRRAVSEHPAQRVAASRTARCCCPRWPSETQHRDAAERAQGRRDADRDRAQGGRASGRSPSAAIIRPTWRNCANCCCRSATPRSWRRRPRIPRISRSSESRIRPSPAQPARRSR